jgi:hypothetical protein
VISPLTVPAAAGEKPAFKLAVCPGVKVVLLATPVAVKPAPVTDTLEIVTLVLPTLVSVAPSEFVLPSATLPKSKLAALEAKPVVGVTALAVAATVSGELVASLITVTEPVAEPAARGANTKLNVALEPAATFAGIVRPLMLNPVPVTVALEIVASAVPLLSSAIVCELLDPVATFVKLALLGLAASCAWLPLLDGVVGFPAGDLEGVLELEAPTTPAHPFSPSNAMSTVATANFARLPFNFVPDRLNAEYFLTSDHACFIVLPV